MPHLDDVGVLGEPARELRRVLLGPLDAQGERAQAAQREPHLERPGDRAVERAVGTQRRRELRRARDGRPQHDVGVPGEVLRHRVHDDVRAVREGLLAERGRERVVDRGQDPALARRREEGGKVGDLEHGVRRGLDEEERRAVEGRDDLVGVGDVDAHDLDAGPCREVVREAERHLVGVARQHDLPARGHGREHRGDRRHPGAEHHAGVLRALERGERLLERVPRLGVHPRVQELARLLDALRHVRRGQHDRGVHGRALRPLGASRGDGDGRGGQGVGDVRVAHGGSVRPAARRVPRATTP